MIDVDYRPAWLTWVASASACLRALGVPCDNVDVAGQSGYAFHLGIHRGLCPSGPTVLDWYALLTGPQCLGRSTEMFHAWECHEGERKSERTLAACRQAFLLAKREVEAGRPCVLWGTHCPEFGVVVGTEGDGYLVRSFKSRFVDPEPAIPFDAVQAPGGPYLLAFPGAVAVSEETRVSHALGEAVRVFRRGPRTRDYAWGEAGYDLWIEALEARRADAGGLAYNAACYAEGRAFARDFLRRLAEKGGPRGELLGPADGLYARAAEATAEVSRLFPFPGTWGEPVTDGAKIASASEALRAAKAAEVAAIDLVAKAASL